MPDKKSLPKIACKVVAVFFLIIFLTTGMTRAADLGSLDWPIETLQAKAEPQQDEQMRSFSGSSPTAVSNEEKPQPLNIDLPKNLSVDPQQWTSPEGFGSTLKVMVLLTVLSLAPAVLLMTTCFVRIMVVLSLLRQALGTGQLPPTQVLTSLALFLSILVMAPTWKAVYDTAIVPYTEKKIELGEAWKNGVEPIRNFMSLQIQRTDNAEVVHMFLDYLPETSDKRPTSFDQVPLKVLVPAFMLSELKTAFLIGFQIFLPFLIIDMVVAAVMVSMGMLMLPPVLVSLPMKLLLFILVDGWNLIVGMLMNSFFV